MNKPDCMKLALEIIKQRKWRNTHLIHFAEKALEGKIDIDLTDFKSEEELDKFKKHIIN